MITSFSQLSKGVSAPEEWAALYYAFYVHRCAIRLHIDNGRVRLDAFVNTKYDNRIAWGDADGDANLHFARGSMHKHYADKQALLGYSDMSEPGFLPTVQNWWLNGHTLCNVVPQNVWSLRGLKELEEMFQVAAPFLQGVKGVYVINKRDSPIMRNVLAEHPFPALGKLFAHPMHVRPMRPPLSFYTGPGWADVAIPPPEAWQWATRQDECGGGHLLQLCFRRKGKLLQTEFDAKLSKGVFRGTATGAGLNQHNQRLALCNKRGPLLDAGITAWNKRDRVLNGQVDFQEPCGQLVPPLTPKEQSGYKILVCVDGHQAPSRLIWHLCSGCALVLVDSGPHCLAPKLWVHEYLQENVNYVRVKADLSDLEVVLIKLLTNTDFAFSLAKQAYALAYERLTPTALAEACARAVFAAANERVTNASDVSASDAKRE
jgi:hypothetical protein